MSFKRSGKNKGGFSLIELLLVMAIVAILSSVVVIWFIGYQRQADLDSSAKMIVDTLRDAQARSISGKDFQKWGVYFDSANNKYILFRDQGAGYDGAGINIVTVKEENYLASAVKIGSLALNNGGDADGIIFNNLGGDTSQYGTIRIELASDSAKFKDIIVTALGKIDRQ